MTHAFLLIGQSNMAGRGFLREAAPIRNQRIRMLRNGRWQMMTEPIHCDRPFAGVGPGASFAQAWCEAHPGEEIGLIPCADGGSSMTEWMPGGALFDHAVMQAKLAQRISQIDGILWHQGETDCPEERIAVYAEKLETMLSVLRTELSLPETTFLIGGLGDYLPECPLHDYFVNAPRMNEVLLRFAKTHAHCCFVTAAGLAPNPDKLHFSAASQRVFGVRYFRAFEEGRSILEPQAGEEDILRRQKESAEMTAEQRIALLQSQLAEGLMTRQEYDFRMDTLISEM